MAQGAEDVGPEVVVTTPVPGRSLKQAVITALILLALIITCVILGPTWFFFLAVTVVLIAQFELLDACKQAGRRPSLVIGLSGGFAMMAVAYSERFASLAIVLAATMYLSFFWALRKTRGPTPGSDIAWTLLSVAWVGGGGAGAVAMLTLGEQPTLVITAFILITALDDIGGYFAGVRFGRHKMAPSISPAKSWEGFLGGLALSLLGGLGFGWFLEDLTAVEGLGLAAIAVFMAPIGDLVESMAKRELKIKDSGRLLPGHGGLLDRLDAIIFCAPAAYLYLHFVVF